MKLSEAKKILSEAGVPNAEYDAEVLFSEIGKVNRSTFLFDDPDIDSPMLAFAIERRAKREPLQYILKKAYFYKEEYVVDRHCLIPRQDTEILVDYAVKHIPKGKHFLDLCAGSGCVGISTLKNTVGTVATLADLSGEALYIARVNAERNGVMDRCHLVITDVCKKPLFNKCFAVLSNPPYVTEDAYSVLEDEIGFEPKMAFIGGDGGLEFYKKLTPMYRDVIADEGFIAYEIGYDQGEALRKIAEENSMSCEIIKDLSGNDRVAVLRRMKNEEVS